METKLISPLPAEPELSYPCLKHTNLGTVVMFTAPKVGMVLVKGDSREVGSYHENLNEGSYRTLPVGEGVEVKN
jgi:hypothetical protein